MYIRQSRDAGAVSLLMSTAEDSESVHEASSSPPIASAAYVFLAQIGILQSLLFSVFCTVQGSNMCCSCCLC